MHQKIIIDIYNQHLHEIGGICFTRREIDVLACMVIYNRSEKMIASMLSISPRTVGTHISNIKKKFVNSKTREEIQNVVYASGKLAIIKEYYIHLRIYCLFIKTLNIIGMHCNRQTKILVVNCLRLKRHIFLDLEEYLKIANIKLEYRLSNTLNLDEENIRIYDAENLLEKNIYLQLKNTIYLDNDSNVYIKLFDTENTYFSILELIKLFIDNNKLNKYINDFQDEYESIVSLSVDQDSGVTLLDEQVSRKNLFLISTIILLSLIFLLLLAQYSLSNNKKIKPNWPLITRDVILDRDNTLSEIDKKLNNKNPINTIFLLGIEGSGKTTLAREYATNYSKAEAIWEINAESEEQIIKSYYDFAYRLCENEKDRNEFEFIKKNLNIKTKTSFIRNFILQKLKKYKNWLLIFENLNNYDEIKYYIPSTEHWGNGKVIINTSNSNILNNSNINHENIIEIGVLNKKQKYNLFTKIMQNDLKDQAEINKFLDSIPPYPMDISVAAHYLKEEKISYDEYVSAMNSESHEGDSYEEEFIQSAGIYNKTRLGILTSSIQKIINIHPDFKDLLFFCSLINHENIPQELLFSFKDKAVVNDFIRHLKEYSFIIQESSSINVKKIFSLLGNTSNITRNYLKQILAPGERKILVANIFELLKKHFVSNEEHFSSSDSWYFCKHLASLVENSNLLDKYSTAYISKVLGVYYTNNEFYFKANNLLAEALSYYNENKDKYPFEVAEISMHLGEIYIHLGRYRKANKLFKIAQKIYSTNATKYECTLAWSYTLMGYNYRALKQYEKAKRYIKKSLLLHKNCKNLDKKARVLAYLGNVYSSLGKYDKALNLLQKANIIIENIDRNSYGRKYWIDNYIGQVYMRLGNYKLAQKFLQDSAKKYQKLFSKEDSRTVWSLIWLANLKNKIGEYEEAESILSSAYKRYIDLYPTNHLKVAGCSTLLGDVYRKLKKYDLAKQHLHSAYDAFNSTLEKNNTNIAWNLLNLGLLYKDLNEFDKAEELFDKSLQIYIHKYGFQHENSTIVYAELGYIKFLKGDISIAKKMINKALKVMLTKKYLGTYATYVKLASIYESQVKSNNLPSQQKKKLYNQMLLYMNKASESAVNSLPPDSPYIKEIQHKTKQLLGNFKSSYKINF